MQSDSRANIPTLHHCMPDGADSQDADTVKNWRPSRANSWFQRNTEPQSGGSPRAMSIVPLSRRTNES